MSRPPGAALVCPRLVRMDGLCFCAQTLDAKFPSLKTKGRQKTAGTAGHTRIRGKRTAQRGSPGPKTRLGAMFEGWGGMALGLLAAPAKLSGSLVAMLVRRASS